MTKKIIKKEDSELSYDTKTLVTIILLITVYPVGVVLMFVWMNWNKWIKFLIVLPLALVCIVPLIILAVAGAMLVKVGDNLTKPETIKEIKEMIVVSPTGVVTPTKVYKLKN